MPLYKTFLTVKNNTTYPIKTSVRWVDPYDWDGNTRPDTNFNNLIIQPKEKVIKREEINIFATANMYTLDITCNNKETISCRIDQGVASNRCKEFQEYLPLKVLEDAGKLAGMFKPVATLATNATTGIAASSCEFADKCYTRKQHYERGVLEVTPTEHYDALIKVIGNNITIDVIEG